MEESDSKKEKYNILYKTIFILTENLNIKKNFDAFLIDSKTVPNLINLLENLSILFNEKKNENFIENFMNNTFQNYEADKDIKLFSFEECEKIQKNNLENESKFIIVDKNFIEYMNIKDDDINLKKVKLKIDELKSLYEIEFFKFNKTFEFITIKPGIYQFKKNNTPLENIISTKIIFKVLSHLKEEHFLKLIKYSKKYQKKLKKNIIDYQEIWAKNRYDYNEYLIDMDTKKNLYNEMKNDLLSNNIDNDKLNTFVLNYFKNYWKKINNNNDLLYENSIDIDFTSPFFDILRDTDFFYKIFNIVISSANINFKKIHKTKFEELNKLKCEYLSIVFKMDGYCNEKLVSNILSDININFKNIKKLRIPSNREKLTHIKFLKRIKLIDFSDIPNTLVYFEYELPFYVSEGNNFINLNNLKSLRYLYLSNITFKNIFQLDVKLLKCLKLVKCKRIFFGDCDFQKLKYLELLLIDSQNKLFNFPELDTLLLSDRSCSSFQLPNSTINYNYDKIIDFKSLEKLKFYSGPSKYFLILENIYPLEKLTLNDFLVEGLTEKIISFKTLKELKLIFSKDNFSAFKDINKIKNKNYSLIKLTLVFEKNYQIDNILINSFQNIFPNLSDIIIKKSNFNITNQTELLENDLIITENPESKIENLKIYLVTDNKSILKINSCPFNKIKNFDLTTQAINIDLIPFFAYKNDIIFDSLLSFKFDLISRVGCTFKRAANLIKNFYDNVEKMQNLVELSISYVCDDIYEYFFQNFIEKILNLKNLRVVDIRINGINSIYSKKELTQLFPKINFDKFHKINIYEFANNI